MKKLFYKVSLFALLILVTYILMEVMVRRIPNEYKYKKEYLDNESGNIEILFIGASDAACGLNPTYTRRRSFNASHPAQSLDYCYEILRKYESKLSSLKYIVLVANYRTLFYKMEESSDSFREKNYTLYYDISNSKRLISHAEISNGQLFQHFIRLVDYYIKNIDEINCDENGWEITQDEETPLDSLVITGIRAAKRHSVPKGKQYFGEMKFFLDSIIDFSKRNNSKIILCTPPVYKSYRENFEKTQIDSTINALVMAAKETDNCIYINLLCDNRFKESDFLDGDHLNNNGAKKLTLVIDSLIMRN